MAARFDIAIDGTCGFCQRSAGWLKALDWLGAVKITPVFEQDMPEMRVTRVRDGRTLGGFDGFRMMAWSVPLLAPGWPLLWIPGVAPIGRRVYRWVARNRHKMPGASDACAIDGVSDSPKPEGSASAASSGRSTAPTRS